MSRRRPGIRASSTGMIRMTLRLHTTVAVAALILTLPMSSISQDVPDSADHPLIGRFDGSSISYYRTFDFDLLTIATGRSVSRQLENSIDAEGKKTIIAYQIPAGPSPLEVLRNFEQRMLERGFEVLYECADAECGRGDFTGALDIAPLPAMNVDPFNFRYIAAKRIQEGVETHAFVITSAYSGRLYAQVATIESSAMEMRMVDATQMAADLAAAGRVALYGIYFDTDSAEVRPESAPTLAEIEKLLSGDPSLNLIVVGHTDNQGSRDYNMSLSARRAESVMQVLVADYSIAPDRLRSAGVGFLAPVATNDSEQGRAQNRRVELIK